MIPKPAIVDAAVISQPLYAQLMSLVSLSNQEKYGGLSDWALQTRQSMASDVSEQHELLFRWLWLDSLINALPNSEQVPDMPAYIAGVAQVEPEALRDTLFDHMLSSTHLQLSADYWLVPSPEPKTLLAETAVFEAHFNEMMRMKFDEGDTQAAHALFNDPERLKSVLLTHLQRMWEQHLAEAWPRAQQQIDRSVAAFAHVPLQNVTILQAMERVTGRDLRLAFRLDRLLTFQRVRFIPHVHNGPYIIWFGQGDTLFIGFPAREPALPDLQLDHTTVVNRCKALADETRLAILLALSTVDSLSTAEIIERFDLDKSAASRHLRQLVATSLISQSRVNKAKKAYRLNRQAFVNLIDNLQPFR